MPESAIVTHIREIVRKTIKEEGPMLLKELQDPAKIEEAVEAALDKQLPLAVVAELHRQFTGVAPKLGPGGKKAKSGKRPKCPKCFKAMRSDKEGGWECRKCGRMRTEDSAED